MKNIFLCGTLLLATGLASGQESLWGTNHRAIIVNTKASGADVQTDVANFPLLVRLDSANASEILAGARPDGGDLRITDATGMNPVAFELEYWNATQKRAALWILAPLVKGNDSAVAFRLYWGRDGATSVSNPQAVFDTARGFQAVFHFSEGTSDTGYDATANAFRAAPYSAPADTAGVMGRARHFNGSSQYFVVAGSDTGRLSFRVADNFTLSAWVRLETTAAAIAHSIVSKSDNQYFLNAWGGYWHTVTRANNRWLECSSSAPPGIAATSAVGSWRLITATFKGDTVGGTLEMTLYHDGSRLIICENEYQDDRGRNTTRPIGIGAHTSPTGGLTNFNRHWHGQLDEIRIENRARSPEWIKLSYATQRPGGTAVMLEQPGGTAVAKAPRRPSTRLETRRLAGGLEFVLGANDATGATRARLTLAAADGGKVWSENVNLTTSRAAVWNSGHATAGLYFLRVDLLNASGRVVETETRAIPFAR